MQCSSAGSMASLELGVQQFPAGLRVGDGTTASGRALACHAQPRAAHASVLCCAVMCDVRCAMCSIYLRPKVVPYAVPYCCCYVQCACVLCEWLGAGVLAGWRAGLVWLVRSCCG